MADILLRLLFGWLDALQLFFQLYSNVLNLYFVYWNLQVTFVLKYWNISMYGMRKEQTNVTPKLKYWFLSIWLFGWESPRSRYFKKQRTFLTVHLVPRREANTVKLFNGYCGTDEPRHWAREYFSGVHSPPP